MFKKKIIIMIILVLGTIFMAGCDTPTVQTPESTSENMSYTEAKQIMETSVANMNLDTLDLIDSWSTDADDEEFIVNIVLNKSHYKTIFLYPNTIKESWDGMKESLKKSTRTGKDFFEENGFDTNMVIQFINPLDDNRTLLHIMNGNVTYDFLEE